LLIFFFIFSFQNKFKGVIFILALVIFQISLFYSISYSRIFYDFNKSEKINLSKQGDLINLKETSSKKKSVKHLRYLNKKYCFWDHIAKKDVCKNVPALELAKHIIFSGRINLWINSINYIIDRPILGYGSMSDRIVINQKQLKYNQLINPVSNAFLYALISGGVLSLILFLYFWISMRSVIFKIFKFHTIESIENKIKVLLVLIIFFRCGVENSIMLFGVDFILLLNSIYLRTNK